MKIHDIMTTEPSCINPELSVRDAARRMRDLDVGALPVCANDRLLGMITDRDLVVRALAEGRDPGSVIVRDTMSPGIVYCFDDEDVEIAARKMEDRQIRRLPVLNRDKRLVGIISIGDIATRVHDDRLCGEVLERVSEPIHA
jgi:CBS domain-containing protein